MACDYKNNGFGRSSLLDFAKLRQLGKSDVYHWRAYLMRNLQSTSAHLVVPKPPKEDTSKYDPKEGF